jgi:hypothetical protein
VILGEDSSGIGENDIQDCENDEEYEEDVEEPDNLTFGEKTLSLLVEGMNTFQKNMLEFCSFSSKQASTTNTILTSLSKKFESTPLPATSGSSFSSSSSSSSSFLLSSSSGLDESLPKCSFLNSSLANSFMSAIPGIKLAISQPNSTKRDFVNGPSAVVASSAVVEHEDDDDEHHNDDVHDFAAVVASSVDVDVPNAGSASSSVVAPSVDVAPSVVVDVPNVGFDDDDDAGSDALDHDNRLDPEYNTFKNKLDTMLHERIPRQLHHLSFK